MDEHVTKALEEASELMGLTVEVAAAVRSPSVMAGWKEPERTSSYPVGLVIDQRAADALVG